MDVSFFSSSGHGNRWTVADSAKLYQISGWGEPYFSINGQGHVQVSPTGASAQSVDLFELVTSLKAQGIQMPCLIRFPDILRDRLVRLNECFATAIARYGYQGNYRGVYPIKCNQHRPIVEALLDAGKPYDFGLEVGSKPELMIGIAMLEPSSNGEALLICNGYKDREYIETALLATQLGHRAIIVIEQPKELTQTLTASHQLGIKPNLGMRAKLSSQGIGRWGSSSGDRAKFGLTVPQMLEIVETLREEDLLDCLQLLHYHSGSQLSSIGVVKAAIREASQIYAELVLLGAKVKYLDVGGGLAVDYSGSKNNVPASKNYNMQNYANDIVATVQDACLEKNVPAPTLVSESGRAIASHQGVLIFDILNSSEVTATVPPLPAQREPLVLRSLRETYATISPDNYQETYHDAVQFKEEAISLFNLGYLSLGDRANAEQLYWSCCAKIFNIMQTVSSIPEDLQELRQNMATIYYANLSIFQSVPDSWAINQLFPIMPIHRLDQEPTKRGVIADLTCDSDGRFNQFIDTKKEAKNLLELHSLTAEPYYLGVFLMGAYQDIMGNFHNLFGRTNIVHLHFSGDGYTLDEGIQGNSIEQMLTQVQYAPSELVTKIQKHIDSGCLQGNISPEQARLLMSHYKGNLGHYTYLER
ncbi:biosynthetic arginine decarboxylase [[Limnothrix rosea] IAM M-220]|uniref:biosynthetic arginine decarboxylase n=1 Tax=[Limnothrix rosea] IAM M-220 TaxID=454133 RepID=UPI00095B250A|nr:biosynthetic arginine decarboxylase [[Limnothrix rosea] IAM M-220]OKH16915.1 arginine decarboxylase [[Limnothrix rosea] IAM M-220]